MIGAANDTILLSEDDQQTSGVNVLSNDVISVLDLGCGLN